MGGMEMQKGWMDKCPKLGYSTTGFKSSEDHCEIVYFITFCVWF